MRSNQAQWTQAVSLISDLLALSHNDDECLETIFRGQADQSWNLESSLWRITHDDYPVSTYLSQTSALITKFNHHFNKSFDSQMMHIDEDPSISFKIPSYEQLSYLAYLRHIGFPSPLLDWTLSPIVALFFACKEISQHEKDGILNVIKVKKWPEEMSNLSIGILKTIGPLLEAHARHHSQCAQYITAIKYTSSRWSFANIQTVLDNNPGNYSLEKITIPRSLKPTLLSILRKMNMNNFHLFGSEDALAEDMAIQIFGDVQ